MHAAQFHVLPSDPEMSLKAGESSVPAPSSFGGSIFDWVKEGQGFTHSLLLVNHHLASEGEAILDARAATGAGVALLVGANNSVVLSLPDSSAATTTTGDNGDGSAATPTIITSFTHETNPLCSAALATPSPHDEPQNRKCSTHAEAKETALLFYLLTYLLPN
jgi:hypothetical protein